MNNTPYYVDDQQIVLMTINFEISTSSRDLNASVVPWKCKCLLRHATSVAVSATTPISCVTSIIVTPSF